VGFAEQRLLDVGFVLEGEYGWKKPEQAREALQHKLDLVIGTSFMISRLPVCQWCLSKLERVMRLRGTIENGFVFLPDKAVVG
jgi:hypothetical protein